MNPIELTQTVIEENFFSRRKVQWFLIYALLLTGVVVWTGISYIGYLHLTGRPVFAESLHNYPTPKECADAFRKSLEEPTIGKK